MNTRTRSLYGAIALPTLLVAVALTSGCGNTRVAPPDAKELSDVRSGRRVMVLLRGVAQDRKGAARTAFGPGAPGGSQEICRADLDGYGGLGSPRRGGLWSVGKLRSPTRRTLRDGWVYFLLRPGTYYLSADDRPWEDVPPVAADAALESPAGAATFGWLLDVPADAPLVYAGTLSFAAPRGAETPRVARILDESAASVELAAKHLPALTPPRTAVVQPYFGPVDRTVAGRLSAAGVRVGGSPEPKGFDVRYAVVEDATKGGRQGIEMLSHAGGSSNSPADLLILLVAWGWTGVGAVSGAIGGTAVAKELQPCVNEAAGRAAQFDLPAKLAASLKAGLRTGHPGKALTPTLKIDVQDVRLRPCQRSHIACVEVRLRAKLWDPKAGRHFMDRTVLYSSEHARYRIEPDGYPLDAHVMVIDEAPTLDLRALARAPADERHRQIDAELRRAVERITARVLLDLRPPVRPVARPQTRDSGAIAPRPASR